MALVFQGRDACSSDRFYTPFSSLDGFPSHRSSFASNSGLIVIYLVAIFAGPPAIHSQSIFTWVQNPESACLPGFRPHSFL